MIDDCLSSPIFQRDEGDYVEKRTIFDCAFAKKFSADVEGWLEPCAGRTNINRNSGTLVRKVMAGDVSPPENCDPPKVSLDTSSF